jgi:hypothetical protein
VTTPATTRRPAHPGAAPAGFTRQHRPAAQDIPVITTAAGPAVHVPMAGLVIDGVVLGRKTRKPTGVPPWPVVLVEGYEKSGKTWAAVLASASPGISATYWLDVCEGAADEYGAITGADYEIVEHDGSFNDIMAATDELDRWGEAVLAAGKPPICIVVDTIGEIWEWLKDWANDLARSTRKARETLARDPNADITISPAHWNMANARFNAYVRRLKRFHGIVILLAQGKEVAVIENGQPVIGKTAHRVETNKSLPAAVNLWIRLYRDQPGEIIGGRSVKLDMRPGGPPKTLREDWTMHNLIFDELGCEVGKSQVRQITEPKPDAVLPQQIADEAIDPVTTMDRLRVLRALVVASGYDDVIVDNERGQEEMLLPLVDRVGTARLAAAAQNKAAAPEPAAPPAPQAGEAFSDEAPAAEPPAAQPVPVAAEPPAPLQVAPEPAPAAPAAGSSDPKVYELWDRMVSRPGLNPKGVQAMIDSITKAANAGQLTDDDAAALLGKLPAAAA